MTISVYVAVNDGLVLAADSATTMQFDDGETQVYNHADKIFNLYKGLPIGAATWGLGAIGRASMATLSKDFRRELTNGSSSSSDEVHEPYGICTNDYSIKQVADQFKKFLLNQLEEDPSYEKVKAEIERLRSCAESDQSDGNAGKELEDIRSRLSFNFRIAGYGAPASELPEQYLLEFDGETIHGPRKQEGPIAWGGQSGAIERLLLGMDGQMVNALQKELEYSADDALGLARQFIPHTENQLVFSAMPIIDAIDLARFLVDTTVKYTRFLAGAQVVGGPTEVATITRHEGFKWIHRKHFFDSELN